MLGGVCTGVELAFDSCLGQHSSIANQHVHCVDALVQVVLDLVEITLVLVSDLLRNIALGDPVYVLGCHVQRSYDVIDHLIRAP